MAIQDNACNSTSCTVCLFIITLLFYYYYYTIIFLMIYIHTLIYWTVSNIKRGGNSFLQRLHSQPSDILSQFVESLWLRTCKQKNKARICLDLFTNMSVYS